MAASLEVAEHLQQGVRHAVHVREERFCEEYDLHDSSVGATSTARSAGTALCAEDSPSRRLPFAAASPARQLAASGRQPLALAGRTERKMGAERTPDSFEEEYHVFRRTCHHHHRPLGDELRRRGRRPASPEPRRRCATSAARGSRSRRSRRPTGRSPAWSVTLEVSFVLELSLPAHARYDDATRLSARS